MSKRKRVQLPPFVVIKNGDWYVRHCYPTKKRDNNGKIVYQQISRKVDPPTFARAAEVSAFIEQEHRIAQREPAETSTLAEFMQIFLAAKEGSVTEVTHEHYSHLYKTNIEASFLAQLPIAEIETTHIQAYYAQLTVSSARVHKLQTLLSMAFEQAVVWGKIIKNPTKGTILPRHRPKETKAMNTAEARRFVAECRKDKKYLMFEFALETGLRPQEILALAWGDIDLKKRTVSVNKALEQGFHGPPKVKDPKTYSSYRVVGLSRELAERLALHKAERDVELVKLKVEAGETENEKRRASLRTRIDNLESLELVFPAHHGGHKTRKNINRRELAEVLKAAGLDKKGLSFKSLRHSSASILADRISPKKLQLRLGHADLKTTLRYYVHVDDGSRNEIADTLAEELYGD